MPHNRIERISYFNLLFHKVIDNLKKIKKSFVFFVYLDKFFYIIALSGGIGNERCFF